MDDFLLGIDSGTTMTKAALFTPSGTEYYLASRKNKTLTPKPGWMERDVESLWNNTCDVIRECIDSSGISAEAIKGIGTTGYGNGIYLLDQNGTSLRNGILSTDSRASDVIQAWKDEELHSEVFDTTLQSFWPGQPNALLRWFKENEPETYHQIDSVLLCKDYLKYRLTGEVSTDYTDISGTSLMDVEELEYSRQLLDAFGIPEMYEALPKPLLSYEIAGKVSQKASDQTGLEAGTPVVGGLFDVDASALGAGVHKPHQGCIVAGTWSINEVITNTPIRDPDLFMTTTYAVPGLWRTLEASATSATNLEWFVETFLEDDPSQKSDRSGSVYEHCNQWVESVSPEDMDLLFHPFLYDSNVKPSARAGFYGLQAKHGKEHMLRAIYEGVVFCHLSHVEKLREAGAEFSVIRLTGGASNSDIWSQMFADILDLPIEVPNGREMGARGVALSAGIGVGLYEDHDDAVKKAVQIEKKYEPVADRNSLYERRYREYQNLIHDMDEAWDRLTDL